MARGGRTIRLGLIAGPDLPSEIAGQLAGELPERLRTARRVRAAARRRGPWPGPRRCRAPSVTLGTRVDLVAAPYSASRPHIRGRESSRTAPRDAGVAPRARS